MKKYFISVISIILIAAGCNQTATNQGSGQAQNPAPGSELQTYKNGTYGFKFQYPQGMVFVTPTYPGLEDKIVQLQIPRSDYPKTNFGDGDFSVSAGYGLSRSDCLRLNQPQGPNGSFSGKPVNVNGITFYESKFSDAGAGNLYDTTSYYTLNEQTCIELDETIHTSNIGNYPPGTVTEVDKSAVQSRLDQVLNTFKFDSGS